MPYDYKKECKDLYQPAAKPCVVQVPPMRYVAVDGTGDPNQEGGAYYQAVGLLYVVSYTLKMSPKAGRDIAGYLPYVVPPLEGFWSIAGLDGMDYARKADFVWTSCIRLPDFVTDDDFAWAFEEVQRKKKLDVSLAYLMRANEGLCVHCLHTGPFDDEPATVKRMEAFMQAEGLLSDFSETRRHHEIYLSDPRRVAPERLRTVIRHPVRKA